MTEKKFRRFWSNFTGPRLSTWPKKIFRRFWSNFTGPRLSTWPKNSSVDFDQILQVRACRHDRKKSFVDFDQILQVRACRHDRKKVSSILIKFYKSAPVDMTEKKFRWFWSNFTGPRLSTWPKKSFVDFDQILQVRACRHDRKKVLSILIKFYRSAPVDMTEKKFRRFWSNFTGPCLSTWPKKKVSSILIKFYRSAPVDITEKKSFVDFDQILQVRACRHDRKKSFVDFDQILQVRSCRHDRKKVSSILIKFYRSAPVDMTENKFRQFWSNFTGPRLSTWPKKSFVDFDQILHVRACRHDRKIISSILIKFYRSAPVDMTEKKFCRFWSNFTGPRLSTWPKKKFRRFWSNFTSPLLSTWPKKSFVDFDQILQVRACRHDRKKVPSILIKFYRSAPVDMTEKKFRRFWSNFTGPRLSTWPKKKFRRFWSNFTGPRLSTWPKKSFVDFDKILQVGACRHDRKKVSLILIKFYRSAPVDMTEKKFCRFWSNFTGPRLSTWPKNRFRRFWSNFTGPRLSTWPKKSFVDFDQILQVRACRHDRKKKFRRFWSNFTGPRLSTSPKKKVSSILIKFYRSAPVDMTEKKVSSILIKFYKSAPVDMTEKKFRRFWSNSTGPRLSTWPKISFVNFDQILQVRACRHDRKKVSSILIKFYMSAPVDMTGK